MSTVEMWRREDAVLYVSRQKQNKTKKKYNRLELVENRRAINNSFNQISGAKMPCRRAS